MPLDNTPDFAFDRSDFIDPNTVEDMFDDPAELLNLEVDATTLVSPEVAIGVPLPTRAPNEVAISVEDCLIDLLAADKRAELLTLTGETPNLLGLVDQSWYNEFQTDYLRALSHNPALKWYGKITKMSSPEQFRVEDGILLLSLTPEKFKKTLLPFLGDFPEALSDESPLVSLVYSLAEQLDVMSIDASRKKAQQQARADNTSEQDLSLDQVDFSDSQLQALGDLNISEDAFGESVDFTDNTPDPQHKFKISLHDLSNKALAEHLAAEYPDDELFEQTHNRLLDEGFPKARANEIVGILRYMRLNARLDSRLKPTGNRGAGNVDFGFEV